MILYVLFLINEILCIGICYTRLIRLGMKSNHNLAKEIIAGFKNAFKVFQYFLINKRNKERRQEEQPLIDGLGKIGEFYAALICGIAVFFILPAISTIMVYSAKGALTKAAFALMLVCIQTFTIFREMGGKRHKISNLVSGFREANRSVEDFFENAINIRGYIGESRRFLFILCTVICYLTVFYVLNKMLDAVYSMGKCSVILGVFCIIILFFEDLPEKLRKKKEYAAAKKEIVIRGEQLQCYKDEIKEICSKLGIKDVMVSETDGGILAEAYVRKNEKPEIFIDVSSITALSGKSGCFINEAVKIFIAHELTHIFCKDPGSKRGGIKKAALLYLAFLMMMFASFKLLPMSPIMSILICLLSLTGIIMSSVCFDDRYWVQIMELRADKIGMQVSGISINIYKAIYKELEALDIERMDSTGRFYRFYQKYVDNQSYPALSRRIQSLEQKAAWGIYYYIWLCFAIIRGLIRKEGWYGRR